MCCGRDYVMEDKEIAVQFSTGSRKVSLPKAFRLGPRPNQHHSQCVLWVSSCEQNGRKVK